MPNPQTWNHYSYTINNPILYNDPDGHCGPICAGALLVLAATVAGAVGGAVGYTAGTYFTGGEFDKTSFAVATIGGGLTTGTATTVTLLGGGPVGFLATMGAGTAIQYYVDRKLHGDDVDFSNPDDQIMMGGAFAIGVLGGAIGGQTTSSYISGATKRIALDFGKQTMYQTTKNAARMFLQELSEEMIVSSVKSSVSTFAANVGTKFLELTRRNSKNNVRDTIPIME